MKEEIFWDRQEYLDILAKRIRDFKEGYRQNIAVIGYELAGKTSLVRSLLDKCQDGRLIFLYLETRPETFEGFARRFIGALLYNFLSAGVIPVKEDVDFLILKAEKYIPRTSAGIKSLLSGIKNKRCKTSFFSALLSILDAITEETGKSCVVVLDEFLGLEKTGIKNLYSEWAKKLIMQKKVMYIVVSSSVSRTKEVLAKDLSLLFGNFETIFVENFDNDTSEAYLTARFRGVKLPENGWKNFLVHFTGGSPFYLTAVSEAVIKSPGSGLVEILENLMCEPCGILFQRYSAVVEKLASPVCGRDYVQLLHLISSGHNKIRDIGHRLCKNRAELNSRINYLLDNDTVVKIGEFLQVTDRMFSFWLKFVHRGKNLSFSPDNRTQREEFRCRLKEDIKEFITDTRKPVQERVTELLGLFQDDVIQIERKKIRLTQFREIKSLEFDAGGVKDGLIGRSGDALWIMGFKNEPVTEEDIAAFAKECRKYRNKLDKKIVVALQDIETNARLRALEEKIITWNLENINQLFDIFHRPRVVVRCEVSPLNSAQSNREPKIEI
ncbi:MAG: ATP-binding protein [Candidatus Omnitrophota bacterium]